MKLPRVLVHMVLESQLSVPTSHSLVSIYIIINYCFILPAVSFFFLMEDCFLLLLNGGLFPSSSWWKTALAMSSYHCVLYSVTKDTVEESNVLVCERYKLVQ